MDRTEMLHYKFSRVAHDLIRHHGGNPPPDHDLIVTSCDLDTDKKEIIVVYDFVHCVPPLDDEEDEDEE